MISLIQYNSIIPFHIRIFMISRHWICAVSWDPASSTLLIHIINTMAAGVLASHSAGSHGMSVPSRNYSVPSTIIKVTSYNGRDGVSDGQPHDGLLNRLFRRRSKKTSKLRVAGLCAGNPTGTGEFTAQRASDAENVSIWWRHHDNN